jgi:5,10-methylenetetrahydrofolate reductase
MNSQLKTKLINKEFVKIIEVLPPKDSDITPVVRALNGVKSRFDFVSVVDNPRGIVHMSALACSYLIQKEGFETIMHVSCTNKNRIEIRSQILGAKALGINNILFVTGDHVLSGENHEAKPVYDVDSIHAVRMAKELNNNLFLGAVANHLSGELQITGLLKKSEAGAEFMITQPVYDIQAFKNFIGRVNNLNIKIPAYLIAGIMPLKSAKHAEFINNKIPGIRVPDSVIERLRKAKDPYREGVAFANETIREIKKIKEISGINVMGLFDIEMAKELEI